MASAVVAVVSEVEVGPVAVVVVAETRLGGLICIALIP